jgi:hypothetical protein
VQRTLDTLGSVAGPLLTFALLRLWVNRSDKYQATFFVAGVIAATTLLIIGLAVRERQVAVRKQRISLAVSARRNLRFSDWQREAHIIIRAEGAAGLTG